MGDTGVNGFVDDWCRWFQPGWHRCVCVALLLMSPAWVANP